MRFDDNEGRSKWGRVYPVETVRAGIDKKIELHTERLKFWSDKLETEKKVGAFVADDFIESTLDISYSAKVSSSANQAAVDQASRSMESHKLALLGYKQWKSFLSDDSLVGNGNCTCTLSDAEYFGLL